MPHKRRSRLILDDPRQRAALTSTVRMELLEHLHAAGPATIATIAERMGRTSNSLYHHVRLLCDTGLIRRVGARRSGAREQAIYDVVANMFKIAAEADDAVAERKTIGVILRKAEREFTAAVTADPKSMQSGEFYVGRTRAPLSQSAQKKVLRHLQAIQEIFAEEFRKPRKKRDRTCAMTVAFVPSPGRSGE